MATQLNEKLLTLYEVLENTSKSSEKLTTLKMYMQKDARILTVLAYAFNPAYNMRMPSSEPPYIPSQHPNGIAPIELLHLSNKLYIVYDNQTKQYKKEEIFIRWLEDMAPEEAKILIAIKDRELDKLYPMFTDDFVCQLFGWSKEQLASMKAKYK